MTNRQEVSGGHSALSRRELLRKLIPRSSQGNFSAPNPDLGLQMSRSRFLLVTALTPVALSNCAPRPPSEVTTDKPHTLEQLKAELEITASTTRDEFGTKAAQIVLENPQWMVGEKVEYKTDLGRTVIWQFNERGQSKAVNLPYRSTVAYPDARVPGFREETKTYTFPDSRYAAVYGITDTVNKLDTQREALQAFTEEYFQGVEVPTVFHLVFLPRTPQVPLVDIGGHGMLVIPDGIPATTGIVMQDNRITRFDVAVVIPGIHYEAANSVTSHKRQLINALANEMVSVLFSPTVRPKVGATAHVPQAVTSVAGMLAEVDDSFAQMILGGKSYNKFCDVVTAEMARIGQVNTRNS